MKASVYEFTEKNAQHPKKYLWGVWEQKRNSQKVSSQERTKENNAIAHDGSAWQLSLHGVLILGWAGLGEEQTL